MWLHGMSIFTNDLTEGDDMECMIQNKCLYSNKTWVHLKKLYPIYKKKQ